MDNYKYNVLCKKRVFFCVKVILVYFGVFSFTLSYFISDAFQCVWEIAWHVYLQLFYIFVCVCCLNCLFIRHYFWGCMCYIQYEMFYFFFIAFVVIILIINYWGVFTKLCPLILNFFSFCSFYLFSFMSRSEGLKMLFFNSPSNMIGLWHSLITGNNISCFFYQTYKYLKYIFY